LSSPLRAGTPNSRLPFLSVLFTVLPNWVPIIIKLGPLKKRTALLSRHVAGVAHPEITTPVLLLPLHHPEHARDITAAAGSVSGMEGRLVVTIGDVDPAVPSDRMGVDGGGGRDAVFPLFLHLGMHAE